ncbi:hypothetical protein [Streptomyces lateritius]|uniref:hypothetical protein n=1 Tax=Streptomyces lateritius TaxID=67313 RepID=UPI001677465D|nr:hypothetical protein [Streptomyces lateritius]GGU12223.1 hypothetical protein GCM10010272_66810 [Streptomyces lateritius]
MSTVATWRAILPQVRRMLRSVTGVVGVGLGVGDDPGNGPVWRVYVNEGKEGGGVPDTVLGLPTHVVVARRATATAGPLVITAGAKIETQLSQGEGGSLGCFARDRNGRPVLLSCSHVLFPGFSVIDDLGVYSPDYSSCCSGGDRVGRPLIDMNVKAQHTQSGDWVGGYHDGTWTGGFKWDAARQASETDCATAILDPGVRFHNVWQVKTGNTVTSIPIKGAVTSGFGIGKGPSLGTLPSREQYVRVYNAVNGRLKWGTLVGLPSAVSAGDPDGILWMDKRGDASDRRAGILPTFRQFLILPRPTPVAGESLEDSYRKGEKLSFEQGDSGSVVINYQNFVIGMIIRHWDIRRNLGTDQTRPEFAHVGFFGVATPIRTVLDHLQIEIPAVEEGWSGTAPSAGDMIHIFPDRPKSAVELAQRRGVERLREELRTSVRGRLLLGKIRQHRAEMRKLITLVRPVAAAWRVMQGAAFYHHCVQGVRAPGHRVPTVINGVTRAQLVETMLPLLVHHAGPRLRRDLERYGPMVAEALLPVDTMQDVPVALARPGGGS